MPHLSTRGPRPAGTAARARDRRTRRVRLVGRATTTAAVVASVALPLTGTYLTVPVFLAALVLALTQGVQRYGPRRLATFLVLTFVISTSLENLSIRTGFPFGRYRHLLDGPRILDVPVMVAVVYAGLGYACWMTAVAILDHADERLDLTTRAGRLGTVGLPLLAAALMTLFDLSIDATSSTLLGSWVWPGGGGFFGVPWTNYAGWLLTTWCCFQPFALLLARAQTRGDAGARPAPVPVTHPVVVYLCAVPVAVGYLVGAHPAPTVTDPAGRTWSTHALLETSMVCTVLGVGVMGCLALYRTTARRLQASPPAGDAVQGRQVLVEWAQ